MRALIGRLNGSSPKKASQVQSNEKTLPNGIAEGEWPKGDTNKDARKSAPTISDAHSPLSSPLPSLLFRFLSAEFMTSTERTRCKKSMNESRG